jgi:heme/copper-type cytochrome/quinol oxidase subunit 2
MSGFAVTAVTFAFAGVVFAVVSGLATVAALLVRRSRVRQEAWAPPTAAGVVPVELGPTRGSV